MLIWIRIVLDLIRLLEIIIYLLMGKKNINKIIKRQGWKKKLILKCLKRKWKTLRIIFNKKIMLIIIIWLLITIIIITYLLPPVPHLTVHPYLLKKILSNTRPKLTNHNNNNNKKFFKYANSNKNTHKNVIKLNKILMFIFWYLLGLYCVY